MASLDGQDIASLAGRKFKVDTSLANIQRTDLVVIPGFLFTLRDVLPALRKYSDWLKNQYAQGAFIASMCTATFMLAEAGLLCGRQATTHWAFADLLRRMYPDVLVEEGRILCEDDRLISSGGASAAMDLLLHVIRRFASLALAHQCSRYLLIDNMRTEQSVYVLWSMPKQHGDEAILRVQNWVEERFDQPLNIDELAVHFGFGIRNFKRRFLNATGYSPLAYLQALRIERAKQLLETTRLSFDSITNQVGYEDSNSFRRMFKQSVGSSPMAFRKLFALRDQV
ncbi:HTH-type transcriptional regulator CdhR [compost metagenome]